MYCVLCIVSYRIVSYRIVSYRIVSYRIVSYRIVSVSPLNTSTTHKTYPKNVSDIFACFCPGSCNQWRLQPLRHAHLSPPPLFVTRKHPFTSKEQQFHLEGTPLTNFWLCKGSLKIIGLITKNTLQKTSLNIIPPPTFSHRI